MRAGSIRSVVTVLVMLALCAPAARSAKAPVPSATRFT